MSDKLPEWETLDRVFRSEPEAILSGLPDCTASRRAKQLLPTIYDYVKEAREQARREESASEASMRRAKESGVTWLTNVSDTSGNAATGTFTVAGVGKVTIR